MNEQLKDAVITIAGYDKGWTDIVMPITDVFTYIDTDAVPRTCRASYIPYRTSADAILPVWRKVKEEYADHELESVLRKQNEMNIIGLFILSGDYEAACIELAQIIKSINGKI